MDPSPLDRLERLFQAAQRLPAEERAAFLDAACPDDAVLRGEVESLLHADDDAEAEAFLGEPVVPHAPSLFERPPAPAGQVIGPYKVLRQIGHGGMGDVYLAMRERPFKRFAAIKIIKRGMDTREVVARFEMERQILASLSHPHIARLLDGGVTDDGRPYFAMEYVEGRPITAYCNERRLPVVKRLALFRIVCHAVHFAHQNLVIHRDLKPTNILVTDDGTVKLLDFGIAKLLNPSLSPVALPVTRTELRLMTPEYASPEQVRGESLTTASDVYALGVLLYELLTGHRPFRFTTRSTMDMLRVIAEHPPARPSTRVTKPETLRREDGMTTVITPAEVSAARETTVHRLQRVLRGDLDNIVLTALRKEPERRYGSVEHFAQDVDRYLAGQPVTARPSTVGYRMRKFVRRHRVGVGSGVLAVLALVIGLGVALWQAREAGRERDRAEAARAEAERALAQSEEVSDFLIRLFSANLPTEARGEEVTARELLERGRSRAAELAGQPLVEARMLDVIGQVYWHLGAYMKAQPLLEQALALRRANLGDTHLDVAQSLKNLAFLYYLRGNYAEAEPLLTEALAVQRSVGGEQHPHVPETLTLLGAVYRRQGDYVRAEPFYREALEMRRRLLGDDHEDVATSRNNLALLLRLEGDYDEAERLTAEALDSWRRHLGAGHPYVAAGLSSLGTVALQKGDYATAETRYREALALRRTLFGDEHPTVALTMSNVASVLRRRGRYEEAEALHRSSLGIQRRLLGDHPDVAENLNEYGLLLQRMKRYDEAEAAYREALAMQQRVLGDANPDVATTLNNLGMLYNERAAFGEAETYLREALDLRRRLLGEHHPDVARSLIHLGSLLRLQARYPEAEDVYREALAIYRRQFDDDHVWTQVVYKGFAKLYDAWGKPEEAARYWQRLPTEPLVHADTSGR